MRNTEHGCLAALWRGTEPNTWVLVPDLILTSVTLDHFFNVSKPCSLIGKEDAGPCPAYLTNCREGYIMKMLQKAWNASQVHLSIGRTLQVIMLTPLRIGSRLVLSI